MKLSCPFLGIEISISESDILKVAKLFIEKYHKIKDKIKFHKESKYDVALILEINNFVYQTGKVKLKPSDINKYLEISPPHFRRPLLENIFKKEAIIEESKEYNWDEVDISDLPEKCIKIYW